MSIEAEQAVLGAILLDNQELWNLSDYIRLGDFSEPLHNRIFKVVRDMILSADAATPITVLPFLSGDEAFEAVGGNRYLLRLVQTGLRAVRGTTYAEIVRDGALKRRLRTAAGQIDTMGADIEIDAPDAIIESQKLLDGVVQGMRTDTGVKSVFAYAGDAITQIDEAEAADTIPGITFGTKGMDDLTGGMRPGENWYLAGRPGMGKSVAAGHVGLAAAQSGQGVVAFNLEMQGSAVALRLMSSLSLTHAKQFSYEAALAGQLTGNEKIYLRDMRELLKKLPMQIVQRRRMTITELKIECHRQRRALERLKVPLGLVTIDYLGLIEPENKKADRYQQVTDLTARLVDLSGELEVPFLIAAQLNREVEKRQDKRPQLSDLRDSGSIEQDATAVILLYRPEYYTAQDERQKLSKTSDKYIAWAEEDIRARNKLEWNVAKRRNGRTASIWTVCDMAFASIKDQKG